MQIIGRESGPALFFFLDFFAGAASKIRNNHITITSVSTLSIFRTLNLQSWTKVLVHFCISGAFSISQMPNLSPHPINGVGHVFPKFVCEFQLCIGWREWQLQKKFKKLALFYEGTWKIEKIMKNATLSQGLLTRIAVACKQALLFGRAKQAAKQSHLLLRASRACTFHDIPQIGKLARRLGL